MTSSVFASTTLLDLRTEGKHIFYFPFLNNRLSGNFTPISSFAIFLQLPKRIGKVKIKAASSVLLSKTCEKCFNGVFLPFFRVCYSARRNNEVLFERLLEGVYINLLVIPVLIIFFVNVYLSLQRQVKEFYKHSESNPRFRR